MYKGIALITGSAGFIGFHLCKQLLDEGWKVIGIDSLSDYYDISLKKDREKILLKNKNYKYIHEKIEKPRFLLSVFDKERPDLVIHLAAQAGVRYSIDNPRAYLESNIVGTFELLEAVRNFQPKHILIASTSSAYGANKKMPFSEKDKADTQMSFYAATKKSCENIAHSYSHLYGIPTTIFRFFTVYGPWGRPDMALFKFTKSILNHEPIDVYNHGEMKRDFTYIDDLVNAITLLVHTPPVLGDKSYKNIDNLSSVAPFRIVNIGNSSSVSLMDFITHIETALNKKAAKNMMPLQDGDVSATWANAELLKALTNYKPSTDVKAGVGFFIKWYREYYKV